MTQLKVEEARAGFFKVPILLLKTKSSPKDNYEEHFASKSAAGANVAAHGDAKDRGSIGQYEYKTIFVPVFEHSFRQKELSDIKALILAGAFRTAVSSSSPRSPVEDRAETPRQRYGGLIFTSQRAVEPFARLIEEIRGSDAASSLDELLPPQVKVYTVGPATTRALKAIGLACAVLGEHTGNGEKLAEFILEDYHASTLEKADASSAQLPLCPLLFVIGEQHRGVIPRTLQSTDLPLDRRIRVDELVVYETKVMESFAADFAAAVDDAVATAATSSVSISEIVKRTENPSTVGAVAPEGWIWIAVFSPSGCKSMLEILGVIDATHPSEPASSSISTSSNGVAAMISPRPGLQGGYKGDQRPVYAFIATIGPTTRDYLKREFGFEPHVCATKPSPEGLKEAILRFESELLASSSGDGVASSLCGSGILVSVARCGHH